MQKIAIASHIPLDTIDNKEGCLGGAACYCGLVCRELGLNTILATKVGEDFPIDKRQFLREKGLEIERYEKCNTTRFEVNQRNYSRKIYLRSKCIPLTINDVICIDVDAWIASPIIDELPFWVFGTI